MTLLGLAKAPDVIAPTALSEAVLPQLYVPPVAGVPEDACCVTEVEPEAHVGVDVLASILQFEGRLVVAPIPSKFWVAGVVVEILICPHTPIVAINKNPVKSVLNKCL
jgi:hypothetical protein